MPLLADSAKQLAAMLIVAALLLTGLVLGKDVLIPLAGATIIAFMLSPIVRWLESRGLPDGIAVGSVMVVGLGLLVALTLVLSTEMLSLTARLSDCRMNIAAKVQAVATLGKGDGMIKRASDSIDRISEIVVREVNKEPPSAGAAVGEKKETVVVRPDASEKGALALTERFLAPLTSAGLTVLFTLFLLLQFEDLRDRIVKVLGTDNLSGTTSAMEDAGLKLSRFFLAQGIINSAYGIVVGVFLAVLGVPGALLWGLLACLMRFVPFVGSVIAAVPPILLAAGVSPDWNLMILASIFFVAGEIIMGNFVEPYVLGHSVGLSPFAMIAATAGWTLVWGPVGLLLAAPLTMCLVVLGRYVPSLSFISILLGNEDPLTPDQIVYQRLLAGDELGVIEELDEALEDGSVCKATDLVVLPALALAATDARSARLDADKSRLVRETMTAASSLWFEPATKPDNRIDQSGERVVIVGARGNMDLAAADYLSHLVRDQCGRPSTSIGQASGLTALADLVQQGNGCPPYAVVIVSTGGVTHRQMTLMARRVEQHFPKTRTLILGGEHRLNDGVPQRKISATHTTTDALKVPNAASLLSLLNSAFSNPSENESTEPTATAA